ncbi:phosphodiesterase [Gaiella sp.]|uniref:phosphodiesterase n=1 Tax=Gaiella sp. TaxID=2663207 RepID=UPI003983B2D0
MTFGTSLTIVQLTDCHLFTDPIGSLREIVTRPRLRRVIEDIRRRVPEADLLVVTGDTAHDEAQATYEEFSRDLGDWTDRLRIVPGNHDNRASLRRVFPDACDEASGRVVFRVETTEWLVLGLDSQRIGEDAGELGTAQLTWLGDQLEAARTRNAVVFLHHPPIEVGSPWVDGIGLLDARALENVLAEHPQVRAVISGHVHQEASGLIGDTTAHTSPAVGPQFRPHTETLVIDQGPPAYRIVELHATGDWSTTVVRCASV